MWRQREMICLGPALSDVSSGAEEGFDQSWTEDRGARFRADVPHHGRPLLEPLLTREARGIPETAALEPHEQDGHPPIRALTDAATSDGHRSVDVAIPLELAEEYRHHIGYRPHGYVPLHGDH